MIVAAAVQYRGITMSMPPPARHPTILHTLWDMFPEKAVWEAQVQQGFLTDKGEFVDRKTAMKIVVDERQNVIRPFFNSELFSENLW